MTSFELNGRQVQTDDAPDTPLLWVVRDTFGLTGSKFGCGVALCGACTMHIDGEAQRTCVLPVAAVAGRQVTTIEGLGTPENLHPLQAAWHEHNVPQCGYCQSGQIMSAAALLARRSRPSEQQVEEAMAGNLCRCGCYPRIKEAILAVGRSGADVSPRALAVNAVPGAGDGASTALAVNAMPGGSGAGSASTALAANAMPGSSAVNPANATPQEATA